MQDLDCECRRTVAGDIRRDLEWRSATLAQAREQLTRLIHGQYRTVVSKLLADLRVHTGSNAAIFLLLLVVSLLNRRSSAHLLLPAALLLLATLVSAWFYLFQQDWFFTIIFDDYTGFAYVGYVAAVFALLCDVAMNHARVSTRIINGMLEAVGSAASVAPC